MTAQCATGCRRTRKAEAGPACASISHCPLTKPRAQPAPAPRVCAARRRHLKPELHSGERGRAPALGGERSAGGRKQHGLSRSPLVLTAPALCTQADPVAVRGRPAAPAAFGRGVEAQAQALGAGAQLLLHGREVPRVLQHVRTRLSPPPAPPPAQPVRPRHPPRQLRPLRANRLTTCTRVFSAQHNGVQPRADGGALRLLQHGAVPTYGWQGQVDRRLLIPQEGGLVIKPVNQGLAWLFRARCYEKKAWPPCFQGKCAGWALAGFRAAGAGGIGTAARKGCSARRAADAAISGGNCGGGNVGSGGSRSCTSGSRS